MTNARQKTLYLDVRSANMAADGRALRITQEHKATQAIPFERIGRAVVCGVDDGLLKACLEIVAHGGSVHFQDGAGNVQAALQQAMPEQDHAACELAGVIEAHQGLSPFNWWRDAQRRHAWSMIFRRGYPGDFNANVQRLLRYLSHMSPDIPTQRECRILKGYLQAWVQHELMRHGLTRVSGALAEKGGHLAGVLRECLYLTLTWRYVRWRREQSGNIDRVDLSRLFELQAAAALPDQFQRHVVALASEYHASWNTIQRAAGQTDSLDIHE